MSTCRTSEPLVESIDVPYPVREIAERARRKHDPSAAARASGIPP